MRITGWIAASDVQRKNSAFVVGGLRRPLSPATSLPKSATPARPRCAAMGITVGRPSSRPQSVFWSPPHITGARPAVPPFTEAQPDRAKKRAPDSAWTRCHSSG